MESDSTSEVKWMVMDISMDIFFILNVFMAFSVHVSAQNLILEIQSAQKNSLLEGLL